MIKINDKRFNSLEEVRQDLKRIWQKEKPSINTKASLTTEHRRILPEYNT